MKHIELIQAALVEVGKLTEDPRRKMIEGELKSALTRLEQIGAEAVAAVKKKEAEASLAKAAGKAVLAFLLAMLVLLFASTPAQASEYGIAKNFWSFAGTWTNTATAVTNLNAAADLTTCTDFALQIVAYPTNNSVGAGSFDIVWETSLDGSNWPKTTNQTGLTVGWFSAPFQSNGLVSVWVTNITMNAVGYWRIRHLTNNCNMNFTNIQIRAYTKPRRFGAIEDLRLPIANLAQSDPPPVRAVAGASICNLPSAICNAEAVYPRYRPRRC